MRKLLPVDKIRILKSILLFLFFVCFVDHSFGQNLENLDSYTVDTFYKKVNLEHNTIDKNGNRIDYVYVETDVDNGDYKIELTDSDGDLYEIKDTNLYIKFRGYFGYAGYSKKCLMKVGYYSSTVYKLE